MSAIIVSQRARSPRKVFKLIALMFILVTVLCVRVSHADLIESVKLIATDGAYNDGFGNSVAISGNYVIVGAKTDDEMSRLNCGSAYIFQRSGRTWRQMGNKLIAVDGAPNDTFGSAVSINGEYAIVGAPFHSQGETNKFYGGAYVFKLTGSEWQQVAKLSAPDKAVSDYFGASVSINGDYAIVGVPMDDDSGSDSGSAHIFARTVTGWTHMAKLVASDGAAGDHFGQAV